MKAERRVQLPFRKNELFQALILVAAILAAGWWLRAQPDRREVGWRTATLRFDPVALRAPPGARLAGAWRLTSSDPRFGGASALALAGDELVALGDSGLVMRFRRPAGQTGRVEVGELPEGPGDERFKVNRDSEALLRDASGRGWWVAFENRDELWLYDPRFRRALERIAFRRHRWPHNRGIEGMAATSGPALALFPERGDQVVELKDGKARRRAIDNPAGRISAAARLPSGEWIAVNRGLTPLGFWNSLGWLETTATGLRYTRRMPLDLGPFDNVEAVAPEILPDGRTRLWLMTDDNLQRPLRTLLIALDLPTRPERQP